MTSVMHGHINGADFKELASQMKWIAATIDSESENSLVYCIFTSDSSCIPPGIDMVLLS